MEEKILAALAQLNGKFDTMQSDMAEMKADIAGLKTDVAGLKTDVAGLKADMAEVKAEQKAMKADIAGLKTDVAELKTDVAGLKTDVAALQKEQAGMAVQLHENHMMLTAVHEAQEVHRAGFEHLEMTTASRESLERLKTTISTQLVSMSEAVANV